MIGHLHRRGPRRARDGQRGAVLVELAFVALFLLTLSAGAFDYGQAWRTGLIATEAARTGARVGSAQGPALEADFHLLTGVRSALASSGKLNAVTRVVIYRSATSDGAPPAVCKTTTSSSTTQPCVVLTGAQFRNIPTTLGTNTLTTQGCINDALVKRWCPTTRNNVQLTAEYLGVWVQVRHEMQFPFTGSDRMVERTAVMRLEPKET